MDSSIKKIVELLGSEDAKIQCAAAVVLGELQPKDKGAAQALGKALSSQNTQLRLCALDAIAKVGGEGAVDAVVPLLKEQGDVRHKAMAVLTALGPAAIKQLKGELDGKDRGLKMAVIRIILAHWSKDSLKTLFQCLFDEDFDIVRFVGDAVRAQADKMDAKQLAQLFKETSEFLGLKKVRESKSATISALRLIGYSKQAKAKPLLLKYATAKNETSVRRHGLVGLRNLQYPETGNDDVIKAMLGYLEEKDFQNIVSAALDVLKAVKIPAKYGEGLARLLKSAHSSVRLFAIEALGQCDTTDAVKALSDLANDPDKAVCEAAATALAKNPAAVGGLVKKLNAAETLEEAWNTAKILRGQAEHLKPAVLKSLTARLFELLEKESDFYRPLYYLVVSAAPEPTYEELFNRGLKHVKAKKLAQAERCLQLIPDGPTAPPDSKFHLAAVRLKQSKKGLSKPERDAETCLKQFADLARKEGFDLMAALKKNPLLGAEELHYLGFHFAEQPEPLLAVGRDILAFVAKKWPKSKTAKDAKAKLETETKPPAPEPHSAVPDAIKKKVESMW